MSELGLAASWAANQGRGCHGPGEQWEAVPLYCQPQQSVATRPGSQDGWALESPVPIHTALLGLSAEGPALRRLTLWLRTAGEQNSGVATEAVLQEVRKDLAL